MKANQKTSRRRFLRTTALSAAALGCAGAPDEIQSAAIKTSKGSGRFQLEEATLADLQRALRQGLVSCESLVNLYQKRIDQLDANGPKLRSVLELNPDALSIARELDREMRLHGTRGPLHGIPILIKDNIETHDRMTTTAGSLALQGSIAVRDAFIVERLRAAGAVLLGKTNLSEWANFRSNRSSSGWSARGGQTLNPYALDRTPCGSSSGSGAAISANFASLSIGTETNGSIVCPSSANGIVGLKPTVGLVSRSGIIPISHSQDTAGPMTRTVADAAVLLSVMAGSDPRDQATQNEQAKAPLDYSRFLDPEGLRGARLGVMRRYFGFQEGVDRVMEEALKALRQAGAELIDPLEMPGGRGGGSEFDVLLYEFKDGLNRYLAGLGPQARVRSLEELIRFNDEHRAQEMSYFGQEIFLQAQAKGPLTEKAYLDALERSRARAEGIDAAVKQHQLDAIIAPTGGPAATIDLLYGDHGRGGSSSLAAVAGYPNLTVPAGFVAGMPVGLSFFGAAFSEPKLIRIGYAFEQATRHRRPPKFLSRASV